MAVRISFDDLWTHGLFSASRLSSLTALEYATEADAQVRIPRALMRDAPAAPLDAIASMPWVDTVVLESGAETAVDLPNVRTLIDFTDDRLSADLLARLPNLEQIFALKVRPEDLAQLQSLRDAIVGWERYDIPRDFPFRELMANPRMVEQFARTTAGAVALAALPGLRRLAVRGFFHREAATAIAEMTELRWLALSGWRDLRALGRLTNLERLELGDLDMTNLRAFRGLNQLRVLKLGGRLGSLDGIESLTALEEAWFGGRTLRTLDPLAALPRLRKLVMNYPDAVTDFGPLADLRGLRELEIMVGDPSRHGAFPGVAFAASLSDLEVLTLRNVEFEDVDLAPLYDLPKLRSLTLTGAAGPDVESLRRARPDVMVETHLVGEPEGRVQVGAVSYDPPRPGIEQWSIFQSLVEVIGGSTNYDAERRVRGEIRRRDPALLKRLEFDSESGAVGIYASSEADIRAVAEAIGALAA